jgi:hypothetical protein
LEEAAYLAQATRTFKHLMTKRLKKPFPFDDESKLRKLEALAVRAVARDDLDLVKQLLSYGIQLEFEDTRLLSVAIRVNAQETAMYLVSAADIDLTDDDIQLATEISPDLARKLASLQKRKELQIKVEQNVRHSVTALRTSLSNLKDTALKSKDRGESSKKYSPEGIDGPLKEVIPEESAYPSNQETPENEAGPSEREPKKEYTRQVVASESRKFRRVKSFVDQKTSSAKEAAEFVKTSLPSARDSLFLAKIAVRSPRESWNIAKTAAPKAKDTLKQVRDILRAPSKSATLDDFLTPEDLDLTVDEFSSKPFGFKEQESQNTKSNRS